MEEKLNLEVMVVLTRGEIKKLRKATDQPTEPEIKVEEEPMAEDPEVQELQVEEPMAEGPNKVLEEYKIGEEVMVTEEQRGELQNYLEPIVEVTTEKQEEKEEKPKQSRVKVPMTEEQRQYEIDRARSRRVKERQVKFYRESRNKFSSKGKFILICKFCNSKVERSFRSKPIPTHCDDCGERLRYMCTICKGDYKTYMTMYQHLKGHIKYEEEERQTFLWILHTERMRREQEKNAENKQNNQQENPDDKSG
ncbi:uncharacterized protein LOC106638516 [Copidosoma floridanum]|uniref:uncharacterized protein LOC106638516 n=1 Tax=Copidosoma floridanum TaxID=29053 RepID=UPI0006C94981|nr:uncharacterized protein LOC106638516 [Copidosoma floridanum]